MVRAVRFGEVCLVDAPAELPDGITRLVGDVSQEPTRIIHTPPYAFGALRGPAAHNIGMTVWETERLPIGWRANLQYIDELWVPSSFCREVFERDTRRPVFVIPHPISPPRLPEDRRFPCVPDDIFLFGSILQWSDRKNPDGLLRAFRQAFRGRSDVGLLLKLGFRVGDASNREVLGMLRRLTLGVGPLRSPMVFVVGDEVDDTTIERFYARIDAPAAKSWALPPRSSA